MPHMMDGMTHYRQFFVLDSGVPPPADSRCDVSYFAAVFGANLRSNAEKKEKKVRKLLLPCLSRCVTNDGSFCQPLVGICHVNRLAWFDLTICRSM